MFKTESEFENSLIEVLKQNGWDDAGGVLKCPTEAVLLRNWADILLENNRHKDRLNNIPLTDSEMQQILTQINELKTPMLLNGFINGKTISIKRDNPEDKLHFGKEISLKIYDRQEIAAGQSRYQIAQQPIFKTSSTMLSDGRGDLVLLINGMPLIHIELKKNPGTALQACRQLKRYAHGGVFTGIYSLVQIFVAMEPTETLFFANPGSHDNFNPDYYFNWADFNNEPINEWREVASRLLSIPMAHQLIGFYTIADEGDGVLKVMRSYQYYAAHSISDRVKRVKWGEGDVLGGYIAHTTGSGKTMTSFKSAQLIANSNDADKVVFLVDRIELGTQSLNEYRAFAEETDSVQATENTHVLKTRLKSTDPADTLIVTSIQKMSMIQDDENGLSSNDIREISSKRIVFIIDECHRSTFGEMMGAIRSTFPQAMMFGFTGTPIYDENKRKDMTTASIFGHELHRYSIADGIRDKNVLGFDPKMVSTYKAIDLRKQVALDQTNAQSEEEVFKDERKAKIYRQFMNSGKVPMAGFTDPDGIYRKGIEDYVPLSQYRTPENRQAIVENIIENWASLSSNSKFHALFATSSIAEAIEYYRLFKELAPKLRVTALFDKNIDNNEGSIFKIEGLEEILTDYNEIFGKDFTIPSHPKFKKDVAARIAHKAPYRGIEKKPEELLDIVIVVDQMLTGFDSKWINTLYLDKMLDYESVIQAFSRTNRLFGVEKPFGNIRYFRKPYTMKRNIDRAVKLYSGEKPFGLFVSNLVENIEKMNECYKEILDVYRMSGLEDFTSIPKDEASQGKFTALFTDYYEHLVAAKIQGFVWEQKEYQSENEEGEKVSVKVEMTEKDFQTLTLRYKELPKPEPGDTDPDMPAYDIENYLTEIDTGVIDAAYLEMNFTKWLKELGQEHIDEASLELTLSSLRKSFSTLSQDDQKFAELILRDVERGDLQIKEGVSFRDYISQYSKADSNQRLDFLATSFGVNKDDLRLLIDAGLAGRNINEAGRYEKVRDSIDWDSAGKFFENRGEYYKGGRLRVQTDAFFRDGLEKGKFDLPEIDDKNQNLAK